MAIAGCSNIGSFNFGNRFDSLPEVFARKGDYAPRSLRIAQHSAIVLAGAGGVYVGFGLSDDKLHSSILETLSALFFGVLAVVSFYPVVLASSRSEFLSCSFRNRIFTSRSLGLFTSLNKRKRSIQK